MKNLNKKALFYFAIGMTGIVIMGFAVNVRAAVAMYLIWTSSIMQTLNIISKVLEGWKIGVDPAGKDFGCTVMMKKQKDGSHLVTEVKYSDKVDN